jgi:tryptophanyl-tRNA synthetase
MTDLQAKSRVLSGMRPTGRLHLGNYMGALYNWVRLQDQYDCFFFIADLHALTTDYADPSRVRQNTMEIALDFLSAGLDPKKSTIFVQSQVPQHAELHLIFSMFTPLSWLERVPTYKDQLEQLKAKDLNTYGFLGYPLLQSADILLYRPAFVPVGQDQIAHVELTREVARRFNQFYGGEGFGGKQALGDGPLTQLLPEPEVLLTPSPKLPGTDGRKMSKSYGNFISMSDPSALVLEKTSGMSTNGQRIAQSDPGDPELCPVGDLHQVFSTEAVRQHIFTGCRTATIQCRDCKRDCGISINLALDPIRQRRQELEQDLDQAADLLSTGAAKARASAEETMEMVRDAVGYGGSLRGVRISAPAYQAAQSKQKEYDLSAHADWWDQEPPLRVRSLHQWFFRDALPTDITLREDAGNVYITKHNKRAYVTASLATEEAGKWAFTAKPKSYDLLSLLCWDSDRVMRVFVVPQKVYVADWTTAKRAAKKDDIAFTVDRDGERYLLRIGTEGSSIDVSEYLSSYDLLD